MTSIDSPTAARTQVQTAAKRDDAPLEPADRSILEPKPASTGSKVGAGIFPGIIGAGLGGIIGLVGGIAILGGVQGPRGVLGYLPEAMTAVVGIAGAATGVKLGIDSAEDHMRTSETDRIARDVGASTLDTARSMIADWDANSNGRIDLPSEETRVEPFARNGNSRRELSAEDTWEAANAGTAGTTVTDIELAKLMSRFDADRSGTMTPVERQAFDDAHGVYVVRERAN